MTAVVRYYLNRKPVMLGDVLLTAKYDFASLSPLRSLPTAEELTPILVGTAEFVPVDLCQKLVVISNDLIIGWSGIQQSAERLLNKMAKVNCDKPFNMESLGRFLDGQKELGGERPEVEFAGFLVEGDRIHRFESKHIESFSTMHFANVAAIGSGSTSLESIMLCTEDSPSVVAGDADDGEFALFSALQICGNLLYEEVVSLQPLRERFGGGYEIAMFIADKWVKTDNITYIFWHAFVDESGKAFFGKCGPVLNIVSSAGI